MPDTWTSDSMLALIESALDWLSSPSKNTTRMTIINLEEPATEGNSSSRKPSLKPPLFRFSNRLTIRQQASKNRIRLASVIHSPDDPMRVLYDFLCNFQHCVQESIKKESNVSFCLVVNGFVEYLSFHYSKILAKLDGESSSRFNSSSSLLSEEDFLGFTLGQTILCLSKLLQLEQCQKCHIILNDPASIIERLDFIYLSTNKFGPRVVNDFRQFSTNHLVSLRKVLQLFHICYQD